MTTKNDVIQAAIAAADLFRSGFGPNHPEVRELAAAAELLPVKGPDQLVDAAIDLVQLVRAGAVIDQPEVHTLVQVVGEYENTLSRPAKLKLTQKVIDDMIQGAFALGLRSGGLTGETADLMRARLMELMAPPAPAPHRPDGCPACIVRAMTEGTPETWFPNEPASVKGVVLVRGEFPSPYAMLRDDLIPYVDLWIGGTQRVRIAGYGAMLRGALDRAAPTVGDTLTVSYIGERVIEKGRFAGRPYRAHTVEIERGHH